jgi:hypothetical protein
MEQYSQQKDEELVVLFQQGNDDAFTELFKRYDKALVRHSRLSAKRFPKFYEDEFYGYFQDQFVKIVKEFDTETGVYFSYFCKFKFPKLAHNYVRAKLFPRDRQGNVYTSPRDRHNIVPSDFEKTVMKDERFTFEYMQDIRETELFIYLSGRSDVNAKVVTLIAEGYSYTEIAKMFGRTGTDEALRNWTSRIVRKIKDDTKLFYLKSDSKDQITAYAKA